MRYGTELIASQFGGQKVKGYCGLNTKVHWRQHFVGLLTVTFRYSMLWKIGFNVDFYILIDVCL